MKITKEILDDFITQRYKKWLADTERLVTKGDPDEAAEIVNDVIEYTYKRIEDKGAFNCKNIDGYIYTGHSIPQRGHVLSAKKQPQSGH